MKCKNCDGDIIFQNGIAVCSSCGATYKVDHIFESVDVYLCYTESDAQGRRIKDSLIAAEIYRKLESQNIKTFYERISAANIVGDDLALLNYQAINRAKVIIIIGTQEEYFENVLQKYADSFKNKSIIPVYSGMRPENLPADFQKIQALNYDAIGADSDIVKGVLNLLGKGKELEISEFHAKIRKNKRIALIVSSCVLLVAISLGLVMFFNRTPDQEDLSQLTSQQIYDNAQVLMDEGKYLEAVGMFKEISDFKYSSHFIKTIFDRYDGYYQTENLDILFYINIQNGQTADVLLEHTLDGNKKVRFEGATMVTDQVIKMSFTDTQSNTGNIEITLKDDGLMIRTTVNAEEDTISVGNLELAFTLEQRTDRPEEKEISNETIMSWMTERTTLSELKQAGHEVVFERTTTMGGGTNEHRLIYKIANTDIQLLMMDFDLSKVTDYNDIDSNLFNDFFVTSVIAPADVACPQFVGDFTQVHSENGIMYVPVVACFSSELNVSFEFARDDYAASIAKGTMIGVTSEFLIGNSNYNQLYEVVLMSRLEHGVKMALAAAENNDELIDTASVFDVAKKGEKVLLGVMAWESSAPSSIFFYVGNIKTVEVEFIEKIDIGTTTISAGKVEQTWREYPDLFAEFLEDTLQD